MVSAIIAAVLAAIMFALWTRSRTIALSEHDAWRAHHALREVEHDAVLHGAASIALAGTEFGTRAALLLHGFGDTPQTLAAIGAALHARGWTVRAPLFPGHGRDLEHFRASSAAEWMQCARDAYEDLIAAHERVSIVGLSMGGALACWLAGATGATGATGAPRARSTGTRGETSPASLVLITPYLLAPPVARLSTALWPLWQLWRPWVVGDATRSIFEPAARAESLGYGRATPRLLRELRSVVELGGNAAPRVRAPTLAIFSRRDYRIPVATAHRAFDLIGAATRRLEWVERSGHVVTVDYDADVVTRLAVEWCEERG